MSKEWYFQEGGNRIGPIAAAALKKLAESGRITPETLVWRHGTPQWVKAATVRGLIDTSLPPAAPPLLDSPSGKDTDPPTIYDTWHPIDALVAAARRSTPPTLAASLSRTAGFAGVYAAVTAAFVVLLGGRVFAIHDNDVRGVKFFVASACAVIVSQYCSQKILPASEKLILSNQSTLCSTGIPDCLIIVTAIASIAGFVGLLWLCGTSRNVSYGLGGVLLLCSGVFVCLAARHPAELAVVMKPDCTTNEDAIGVLCFSAKLLLRISPVLVLGAVAVGIAEMASLLIQFLQTDFKGRELALRLPAGPRRLRTDRRGSHQGMGDDARSELRLGSRRRQGDLPSQQGERDSSRVVAGSGEATIAGGLSILAAPRRAPAFEQPAGNPSLGRRSGLAAVVRVATTDAPPREMIRPPRPKA